MCVLSANDMSMLEILDALSANDMSMLEILDALNANDMSIFIRDIGCCEC